MRSRLVQFLAISIAVVPLAAASAQETSVDESGVPDAPEARATQEFKDSLSANRSAGGDAREMRLAEAVRLGIENNLNLKIQRHDPLIAFEDQEGAWGSYDPLFTTQGGWAEAREPNTNVLTGSGSDIRSQTKVIDAEASLDTLVPWLGASLAVDFGGSRTRTTQFSSFATLRPTYESTASITATMPLLKGLVWNEPWTRIKTSRVRYAGSQEDFRTDLMDVVQFIEIGYWNLVAQKQSVRVAQKSLETALSLLDQTRTEYEVGVKSKVEVVEADAGVASREFDLILAVNRYRTAQDNLIDSVLGTELSAATRLEIVPADDPEAYVTYQIDLVEAAEKAFVNRPELKQAEFDIERQEFELKFAKNQRLPQFDVVGSYGVSGTRGSRADLAAPNTTSFQGNFGDTYDDWFSSKGGREYTVRGVLSIPLGNIAARHSVSRRNLELRRSKAMLTQLRQQIVLEVRDGARDLQSAQEGIEAAERRRLAAAEQLRAERVRLEYGESTPFNVLLREEDLVEAENEKILALFTYRKSVVDLHRAQGTILEARNILVQEAARLR